MDHTKIYRRKKFLLMITQTNSQKPLQKTKRNSFHKKHEKRTSYKQQRGKQELQNEKLQILQGKEEVRMDYNLACINLYDMIVTRLY